MTEETIIERKSTRKQQTSCVSLKRVGESLWVSFDPSQPRRLLEDELARLFGRMKHLVFQSRVILDPETAQSDENLIDSLGAFLKETFGVGFVSGPPQKRSVEEELRRRQAVAFSWRHQRSDVLMLTGRVRSGQKVSAKNHFVLMGDLNPGGEVVAGGDVLVMGSMLGTVAAGQPDKEDAIILALDFRPTQIKIGGYVARGIANSPGTVGEFAFVENNSITVANYLKVNPFGRLPWPEVR